MISRVLIGAALSVVLLPMPAATQVVREDDQKSIAGVIGGAFPSEVSWTFKSAGGEILFASLDGEIYLVREGHDHEVDATACGEEEGSEGCEDEGGPARFCLQVINAYSQVMCQATRPTPPPGWQRDPRLACLLPATGGKAPAAYTLRVSKAVEGACTLPGDALSGPVTERPFLLNLSLRRIAPAGVSVQQATAHSKNQF